MVTALGYDPLWYGVLFLMNIEISPITPPFGLSLFIMQGVAPEGTLMKDIIKGHHAVYFIGPDSNGTGPRCARHCALAPQPNALTPANMSQMGRRWALPTF